MGSRNRAYLVMLMESDRKKELYLYLVRHGETQYNQVGVVQGWCDSELTALGKRQADEAGMELSDVKFTAVYSGDLGRQAKTARRIISKNRYVPHPVVQERKEFREVYYGSFEGQPVAELMVRAFAEKGRIYSQSEIKTFIIETTSAGMANITASLDGKCLAENAQTAEERLMKGIRAVIQENKDLGGNVLIVTSGSALGMLIPLLVGKKILKQPIRNGGITVLKFEKNVFRPLIVDGTPYP